MDSGGTEAPAIRSKRQSPARQLPDPPRGVGCERAAAPVFLAIGIIRRRLAPTILDGDASSLTNGKAERLETNTSMPHITCATSSGPGEPRVRIPVKRFLACPFNFHRQPRSRGGVLHHPRYRVRAHFAAAAPFRTIESFLR